MSNPRFPHWCRIIRKTTDDPMEDEEDFSLLHSEEEYDPMGGDDTDEGVATGTGEQNDDSLSAQDPVGGSQTTVIYEGECRSYKINTTSDKGDIITSQRGLALPLNQDGWDARGLVPLEGDEVIVVHGSSFQEYGRIVDKSVATASYAGTHLIWRYGRN